MTPASTKQNVHSKRVDPDDGTGALDPLRGKSQVAVSLLRNTGTDPLEKQKTLGLIASRGRYAPCMALCESEICFVSFFICLIVGDIFAIINSSKS